MKSRNRMGPNWFQIFISILVSLIAFWICDFSFDTGQSTFLVVICMLGVIDGLKYIRIDEKGIHRFWMGIHLMSMPWDQIDQIGSAAVRSTDDPDLLVTMKGCKRFDEARHIGAYIFFHPIKVHQIVYPYALKALPLIHQYYGKLDYTWNQKPEGSDGRKL